MDYTAMLVKMLPESWLPYLKFIVTVLGGAASSVLAAYPNVDHRIVIATAVLTALGTYLTPNIQPVRVTSAATAPEVETPEVVASDGPESAPETPTAETPAPVVEVPAAVSVPPVEHVGV